MMDVSCKDCPPPGFDTAHNCFLGWKVEHTIDDVPSAGPHIQCFTVIPQGLVYEFMEY